MKRLFIVDSGYPQECAELVVAETEYQARIICMHGGDLEMNDYSDPGELHAGEVKTFYMSTEPIPQSRINEQEYGILSAPSDDKLKRDVGFACEGDDRCEACGLASMDGRFPICDACGGCEECGHDDECEEKEHED